MITPLLHLQEITLKFPRSEKQILSHISYLVKQGDFIIILGSNGSGKSSLLKLIDKRYPLIVGEISLEGKSIKDYSARKFSHAVKTLTQNCQESLFVSLTVFENYLLIKQQYEPNLFSIHHLSERQYFSDYLLQFSSNLASKLNQTVNQLSGGEKQTLALALIMLYPPRILLLDEHTSALDPKSAQTIMSLTKKIVEKYQITCLLTTHNLSEAKNYGNRILALRNGEIYRTIDQEEKEKLTQQQLLALCY